MALRHNSHGAFFVTKMQLLCYDIKFSQKNIGFLLLK